MGHVNQPKLDLLGSINDFSIPFTETRDVGIAWHMDMQINQHCDFNTNGFSQLHFHTKTQADGVRLKRCPLCLTQILETSSCRCTVLESAYCTGETSWLRRTIAQDLQGQ